MAGNFFQHMSNFFLARLAEWPKASVLSSDTRLSARVQIPHLANILTRCAAGSKVQVKKKIDLRISMEKFFSHDVTNRLHRQTESTRKEETT